MTEVTLPGTAQFILPRPGAHSDHLVRVAGPVTPPGAPHPVGGYPVVIILDGDHLFGTAFEAVRMRTLSGRLPPSVVVGLTYRDDLFANMRHRAYDFTPPTPEDKYPDEAPMIGTQFGGAGAYLDFILGDLWGALEALWPVDPARRALVGYSLGGMFALGALFGRPDAFRSVCALSPSIWWNDFALLQHLPAALDKLVGEGARPSVLFTAGGQEQDPPITAPPGISLDALAERVRASRMIDAAAEMAAALGADIHVFDGEDHASVIPAALGRALDFALRPQGASPQEMHPA